MKNIFKKTKKILTDQKRYGWTQSVYYCYGLPVHYSLVDSKKISKKIIFSCCNGYNFLLHNKDNIKENTTGYLFNNKIIGPFNSLDNMSKHFEYLGYLEPYINEENISDQDRKKIILKYLEMHQIDKNMDYLSFCKIQENHDSINGIYIRKEHDNMNIENSIGYYIIGHNG